VTPEEVARLLVEERAVEVRPDPAQWFTWASGRRAPIYCDNRVLLSAPKARTRIVDALVEALRAGFADPEVVAGTATAGIPWAAWVAERIALPMVYVRGEAKDHGRRKRVEGARLRGERTVLIEDLISFGGSSLSAIDALREEGGEPLGVQAIFSYGFTETAARFARAAVAWRSLSDYEVLLATLDLSPDQARALHAWRES
jgi:orotate phosphoribosyltransferase